MTALFVTRHAGAVAWAARRGIAAEMVDHLDIGRVRPDDVVMGTLPLHLAAAVCARGARFLHLELDLPPDARGRPLTADDMDRYGAALVEYRVERVDMESEGEE
ncbi:CRISPR-associated protein Csx16 [Azospirillum sp. RWY-5-1]|uniref:CRISPR-associated protein Csx16 n=1 Tax=Azospirillum oleiclasticum TaxID=2735135 RepID=A0ABX2T950_9PROT|nr:CRISPR-associated protein Csx16 [Azospirillum oleiclasticum]NYZ13548.1 CRISPR-associated protein Csx16 [Azospirillum oleiclasticum]NYZ20709.1 CRISPR-associated protein Csx16 [Azospirillum oleiclasticum]